jgi:hypothetical protein
MGNTRVKKNKYGLVVNRESTRHYRRTLWEFGESGEVHPSLADLDYLLLSLTLAGWVGCLPWKGPSRLRAILDEVGRASAVETTIIVVSLGGWRKAQPQTLLWLLLGLRCWWSIESCLLGWSVYPSAWQSIAGWYSGSGILN